MNPTTNNTQHKQQQGACAALAQAETFEGRIARVKVAFDEAKESVGAALLPIIEKLIKYFVETAIPALEKFKKNAIDPVIKAFKDNEQAIRGLYNFAKDTLVPFLSFTLAESSTITLFPSVSKLTPLFFNSDLSIFIDLSVPDNVIFDSFKLPYPLDLCLPLGSFGAGNCSPFIPLTLNIAFLL